VQEYVSRVTPQLEISVRPQQDRTLYGWLLPIVIITWLRVAYNIRYTTLC